MYIEVHNAFKSQLYKVLQQQQKIHFAEIQKNVNIIITKEYLKLSIIRFLPFLEFNSI